LLKLLPSRNFAALTAVFPSAEERCRKKQLVGSESLLLPS
jgi:hypothetical protein